MAIAYDSTREKYYLQQKQQHIKWVSENFVAVVVSVAIEFMLHQLASSINKLHAFCMFRVDTKQW